MKNIIEVIKIVGTVSITHLLFVDDVLLFGQETITEWRSFKEIVTMFCDALGLEVSVDKSCFIYACDDEDLRLQISDTFHFKMVDFKEGLKYLGFHINQMGIVEKIGIGL